MALKGTTIESVHIDVTAFKHEDTTVDFHINLSNIYGDPVRADSTHTFTAKVANKSGYLADFPCAIDGTNLLIDSDEFFNLPPGDYYMEVWETWTNEDGKKDTAIYPSPSQVLQFTINPNIEDNTGKIIETIDFKTTIENTVKDFLKNHPGAGTGNDIDLSDYYKKSDIDRKLTAYPTKADADDKYLAKSAVTIDTDKRILKIGDKSLAIPANVSFEHLKTTTFALDSTASPIADISKDADGKGYTLKIGIPRGRDGESWEPYIANDGNWHIKKFVNPEFGE